MPSERRHAGSPVRLGDLGSMVVRFFDGLVSPILATVLGAVVIGFVGFNVGDKNVGFNMAGWGALAGTVLGLIGLAWYSIRRRDGMPLWGGITAAALEWAFVFGALGEPL